MQTSGPEGVQASAAPKQSRGFRGVLSFRSMFSEKPNSSKPPGSNPMSRRAPQNHPKSFTNNISQADASPNWRSPPPHSPAQVSAAAAPLLEVPTHSPGASTSRSLSPAPSSEPKTPDAFDGDSSLPYDPVHIRSNSPMSTELYTSTSSTSQLPNIAEEKEDIEQRNLYQTLDMSREVRIRLRFQCSQAHNYTPGYLLVGYSRRS